MPTPRKHRNNAARQKAYRFRMSVERMREQQAKGLPATPAIPTIPGTQRWEAMLLHAQRAIEKARDEMDIYHSARSEAWRESENAEALMERMKALDALATRLGGMRDP